MITSEQFDELEEWGQCEGSEWGETVLELLRAYEYKTYYSNTFVKAMEKEITRMYKEGKKYIVFVEREETITRTVREFVWDE